MFLLHKPTRERRSLRFFYPRDLERTTTWRRCTALIAVRIGSAGSAFLLQAWRPRKLLTRPGFAFLPLERYASMALILPS